MFNIGFSEFLIIGILALVLLGPEQLPSAIRSLAKVIRDIRKTTNQLKEQIDPEFDSVTRDLRDAIEGDMDAPRPQPSKKKALHYNKPEATALPPAEEEIIVVQAPSEEEGRPLARGAAQPLEPNEATVELPAPAEEIKL